MTVGEHCSVLYNIVQVRSCTFVQRVQRSVRVVTMDDVLCRGKDAMELTTAGTIPMKLTAV